MRVPGFGGGCCLALLFVYWSYLIYFCRDCAHMFATGEGLLKQIDTETSDGLKEVFTTNLFGHFVLVNIAQY